MAKVALGCVGKYLKGSGAESILLESGTFGVHVVDSVLGGINYSRSLKGLQLLKEVLLRLQWEAFFKEGDNVQVHKEHLDVLVDLKGKIASASSESFAIFLTFEETAMTSSETLTISLTMQRIAMKPSNIGTHSSTLYSELKTLFMLTKMESRNCIYKQFRPYFPSLKPLIQQIIWGGVRCIWRTCTNYQTQHQMYIRPSWLVNLLWRVHMESSWQ